MTERDAFEARFGAAVSDYVRGISSDLDPADLAHRIAASAPRRHGRAAVFGWGRVAIGYRAWLLLLLTALLTVLVAGAIVVGSQREPTLRAVVPPIEGLAACPPGSTPDTPGPLDQARPPWDAQKAIALDRRAGRLVAVVRVSGRVETWTFDVCANTWTQMHPGREPVGINEWDLVVYDADSDVTIAVDRSTGSVWAYDLPTDTWTEKGDGPIDAWVGAYDPRSGLVVVARTADRLEMWDYDVGTDVWTPVRQANGPIGGALAYDASVDRMVVYAEGDGPATWLLDMRTGTWSRSRAEMPGVAGWWVAPGVVYDEAVERTVVLRRAPMTAYDATADRWEIVRQAEPPLPDPDPVVYDPLNRRLVGLSGPVRDGAGVVGSAGAIEALDLATGEWTVLLEPREARSQP